MSRDDRAPEAELADLITQARAYLEIESALGNEALARVGLRALEPAPAIARAPKSDVPRLDPPAHARVGTLQSTPDSPSNEPGAQPGAERAPLDLVERVRKLHQLALDAQSCTRCDLHAQRKQSVFARGNPQAELVFVGEGPGAEEDRLGEPFVGPAGKLLDRMIAAMGYARDEVYICNVVKCRPPENRTPRPEEAIACRRFLVPQLELVAPKAIVALGRCAAENLGVAKPEGPWRGRWGAFQGVPVLPTYHPAYLLRSPDQKRVVWEDLQLVLTRLGRAVPERKR